MSVYVDKASNRRGRMVMSHMMADSNAELDEFAARLGLQPSWRHGDHYDVSQSKQALAIKLGAIEVPARELVAMRKRRQKDMSTVTLEWLRYCTGMTGADRIIR